MLVLLLVLGLGLLMLICVIGLLALLLCGGSDSQDQWQVSHSLHLFVRESLIGINSNKRL